MNVFDNDHEVLQIGALTIENQHDEIAIMGDCRIALSPEGKKMALALYEFAVALKHKFDSLEPNNSLEPDDSLEPNDNHEPRHDTTPNAPSISTHPQRAPNAMSNQVRMVDNPFDG